MWRIENTFGGMTSSDSYSILLKMAEQAFSPPFYGGKIGRQERETADAKSFCAKDRGRDSEFIKPVL